MSVIDLNELKKAKRQARHREWKQKINVGIQNLLKWINENRDLLIVAIPVAGSVLGGAIKFLKKNHTLRAEKHLKEDYVYDRSLGKYLKPTRKLSKNEWRSVARRKAAGERYVDIFDSMGVL